MRKFKFILFLFLMFFCVVPFLYAQETTALTNEVAINTIWVLLAAFLVFFMQAGFAMVESGFTRAKNACNVMMKNLMDFSVGSIIFWLVGFGIMFGTSVGGFFGKDGFMLNNVDP